MPIIYEKGNAQQVTSTNIYIKSSLKPKKKTFSPTGTLAYPDLFESMVPMRNGKNTIQILTKPERIVFKSLKDVEEC